MAYEVSSSVESGVITYVEHAGDANDKYGGGYFGIDGDKLFIPSMTAGGTSGYGVDIWTSSSGGGWVNSGESFKSTASGANYRPSTLAVIRDTELLVAGYGGSTNNARMMSAVSSSSGWTISNLGSMDGYQERWSITMNYSRDKGVIIAQDDDMTYMAVSGAASGWTMSSEGVPPFNMNDRYQGAAWLDNYLVVLLWAGHRYVGGAALQGQVEQEPGDSDCKQGCRSGGECGSCGGGSGDYFRGN